MHYVIFLLTIVIKRIIRIYIAKSLTRCVADAPKIKPQQDREPTVHEGAEVKLKCFVIFNTDPNQLTLEWFRTKKGDDGNTGTAPEKLDTSSTQQVYSGQRKTSHSWCYYT